MVSVLDGVEFIDIGRLKLNDFFFYLFQVKPFPRLSFITCGGGDFKP